MVRSTLAAALVLLSLLGAAPPPSEAAETETATTTASAAASAAAAPVTARHDEIFSAFSLEASFGTMAAVASVPLTLGLGVWLGSLPSNLVLAAAPPLLLLLLAPPLLTVLTELWFEEKLERSGARFWPAFGVAVGVQLVAIVAGVAAGASTRRAGDVALFTAADAFALGSAAALTIDLTRRDAPPAASTTALAFQF